MKKKIVILSGAGISAESGIKTFRDSDGLWENYRIEDVATPEAWRRNPTLVLDFYNQRRKAAIAAQPNAAHLACVALERDYDVIIVTQNVDNLHERAGSSNVVHLHGELFKSRSTFNHKLVYDIEGWELNIGDKCEKGSQLRPHIVWFGEAVPMMDAAVQIVQQADILMVIGTSLQVYPAASLVYEAPASAIKYVIDPNIPEVGRLKNMRTIAEKATVGMEIALKELL